MKIDSFNWFYNKEKDKPCLVAGTAPQISTFPFDKFSGVYITMGDGPTRLREYFEADYWVNANSLYPVPENDLDDINKFINTVFIFADSVCYSSRDINYQYLIDNLKPNWFAFDQRHFNGKKCKKEKKCCKLVDMFPNRQTIQEYLRDKLSADNIYSSGSTVATHALAFAIIMGCNPIYIQGVELPMDDKNYKYKIDKSSDKKVLQLSGNLLRQFLRLIKISLIELGIVKSKTDFFSARDEIIADFSYLFDLARRNGQEVVLLSDTSTLCEIKGVRIQDPLQLFK